jgi:hypothetical protein
MAQAGTDPKRRPSRAAWILALSLLACAGPRLLPYGQVASGTDYAVFYRLEGEHQFLFLCRMPERRLVAVEIDPRKEEAGPEGDESAEVVHHLPIHRLKGKIQYLELTRLPESRAHLLELAQQDRAVVQGVALSSRPGVPQGSWLAVDASALPPAQP